MLKRNFKAIVLKLTLPFFSTIALAGPMTEGYIGRVPYLHGSYSTLIIRPLANGTKQHIYFTEQQSSGSYADRCIDNDSRYYCPGLSIHTGSSPTQVSGPRLVLDPMALIGQDKLTRNGVAYSTLDKRFYAVAYVNYGEPQTGYFFRSLTSNPAGGWESLGIIRAKRGNYSGTNLIVNDQHTGKVVNHAQPVENKFIHYTTIGKIIYLLYSANGTEWFTYKQNGIEVNLRSSKWIADTSWGFASVVKTTYGYFMSVTVGWNPIVVHRLLFSRDGLNWDRQIGTESGGSSARKNFSLSYDASTDTVYSMATESGSVHKKLLYSFRARAKAPLN